MEKSLRPLVRRVRGFRPLPELVLLCASGPLRWLSAVVVAAVLLASASAALASSGGPNPSQAPGLAVGSHAFSSCDGINQEWWALPGLLNFDEVVVDVNESNNIDEADIYPPSADDYNWQNVNTVDVNRESGTNHERLTFTASEGSGRYLIYINCEFASGAYDFTVASIRHAIRIDLVPTPVSLPYRGTLRFNVLNGAGGGWNGGAALILYGSWLGKAYSLGQAVATNGTATFSYRLPVFLRKKSITIWAVAPATDTSLGTVSSHVRVRIR